MALAQRTKKILIWTLIGAPAAALIFAAGEWAPALRRLNALDSRDLELTDRPKAPSLAPATAPPARVPEPRPATLADVPAPAHWEWAGTEPLRLDFTLDLDFLAPLGDGAGNTAFWLRDFDKRDGCRFDAYTRENLIEGQSPEVLTVLHPESPLLREAGAWVDQARCRFYPDVWPVEGPQTRIPNLQLSIELARSWRARGDAEIDPERAKDDYRRAIRLGRLLRQDSVTVIQDLVGLACIRQGLAGLNNRARREGDAVMVAATTLALADHTAIRAAIRRRLAEFDFARKVRPGLFGPTLDLRQDELDSAIAAARTTPLRSLRMEALLPLFIARHLARAAQRDAAAAALEELSRDADPLVAAQARWYAARSLKAEELKRLLPSD